MGSLTAPDIDQIDTLVKSLRPLRDQLGAAVYNRNFKPPMFQEKPFAQTPGIYDQLYNPKSPLAGGPGGPSYQQPPSLYGPGSQLGQGAGYGPQVPQPIATEPDGSRPVRPPGIGLPPVGETGLIPPVAGLQSPPGSPLVGPPRDPTVGPPQGGWVRNPNTGEWAYSPPTGNTGMTTEQILAQRPTGPSPAGTSLEEIAQLMARANTAPTAQEADRLNTQAMSLLANTNTARAQQGLAPLDQGAIADLSIKQTRAVDSPYILQEPATQAGPGVPVTFDPTKSTAINPSGYVQQQASTIPLPNKMPSFIPPLSPSPSRTMNSLNSEISAPGIDRRNEGLYG